VETPGELERGRPANEHVDRGGIKGGDRSAQIAPRESMDE
jgi:hypothetical protein